MNRYRKWLAFLLVALMALIGTAALAEEISTTVTMRVSRMTQSAIVNEGEDLTLDVSIDGVTPASYQWYFNGQMIPNANQSVYNIVNAKVADSGTYRLEAFGEDGRMLVSMDISARVIDATIPKSGDSSLPVSVAVGAFVMAAAVLAMALRRRAEA